MMPSLALFLSNIFWNSSAESNLQLREKNLELLNCKLLLMLQLLKSPDFKLKLMPLKTKKIIFGLTK